MSMHLWELWREKKEHHCDFMSDDLRQAVPSQMSLHHQIKLNLIFHFFGLSYLSFSSEFCKRNTLDVPRPTAFYSTVDTIQVYLKVWLIYISHLAQQKLSAWMKNALKPTWWYLWFSSTDKTLTYNKLQEMKCSFLNITSSTWHETEESKLFKHTSLLCDHGWVGAWAGGAAAVASYKPPLVLPLLISS